MKQFIGIIKKTFPVSLMTCFIIFAGKVTLAQVSISEEEWILPTYKVAPPDRNPVFFKNESYQGASKYIYPYKLNDVFATEKVNQAWKALVLENEYIKLCVAPDIGGKLYYATDKTSDYNFIYKNDVVKPGNIGMTGAWVSGGIEWCVLHHHRVSTFLPVDYQMVENDDGSKTIWIGETELRHRMRWTIGITVFPGKSYFQAEVKIHNRTPYTHSFLYWANVATHTNENYQVIFPPSVQFATYHAKNQFTHWPVSHEVYLGQDFTSGVDVSWWKNSEFSVSYFAHDLQEDFMGGYDHGKQTGTVHIGDHHIVKGAKLWEWGSGPRGQATEAKLTENAGPYVEIMVGAFSDNQPDYSWIRPYEVKQFKQYWYPVKDIGGFKNANLNGAVNLEKKGNNNVFLGYYATRLVEKARILLKKNNEVVFEKTLRISPEKTFAQLIKLDGVVNMNALYTEIIDSETGEVLISYQPVEREYVEELPETVESPPEPVQIGTTEELFLTGKRIEQFYNTRLDPMDYYREALRRDPGDTRTNIAVGNIHLMDGDYLNARRFLGRAIERLTRDYTRPSDCQALYLQGLTLKALELYEEAIDTLYRATWDDAFHSAAYLELARISAMKNEYAKALDEVNKSLLTNGRNNNALCFRAAMQRKLGNHTGAKQTLEALLLNDPLDFRALNESCLLAKASGNEPVAVSQLEQLNYLMRGYSENYLELAVEYLNDGLPGEAEDVLHRYEGEHSLVNYYLGYLSDKNGNRTEAGRYFKTASEQSVDYIFPFRLETIKVLNTALKYHPEDGRAYYYLGNILYDKQPGKALEAWENAVQYDPELAIAYRNLGWGYYQQHGDGFKAINAYEKAFNLNQDEPLWYEELDALYEMSNAPIEKRLKLFEGKNEVVRKRDDAFARQIAVLTLAGKADQAVDYLSGRQFSYREGASRVRDIIIDAHLMLGLQHIEEKNYQEAIEILKEAKIPEEEASSSSSGNRNIQVNYYIGWIYEAMGDRKEANKYFTSCIKPEPGQSGYISYYQGKSNMKLGNRDEAVSIFNSMISEGESLLNERSSADSDFFAKFGAREAENARLSDAYLIKGLGYKGLGEMKKAGENLQKAVDLSASNLIAIVELESK